LARAIDHCLAKAPDERFATGEALAEALAEGTAGRGELPVPLRVFLKRCRETYQGTGPVAVFGFLFAMPTAGAILSGQGAFATGWAFAGLALLSAPFVSVLHQARKLAKAGYGLPDLRLALRQDVAEREEELRFEFGPNASRLATVSRPIMWMAAVTGTLTAVAAVVVPDLVGTGVWQVVGGAAAVFAGSGVIVARDDTRRKDVWGKRSLKFWHSRIGGWMHRLVTGGALRRAVPTGVTHRPTELAIGLAADRLYEELPKAVRAEVPDLPAVVRRLEADAQAVRARIEELTGLLAELGRERTGAAADGKAELRTRLERERVAAEAQLRETVTALETIRLNLLRLHAGVGNIASVTANLDAAREVSDAAARLAEGRREVEKLLGG
jgi:serine/threonine-protein kinase